MRIAMQALPFFAVALALCSSAAAQQDATEGVFQGHGIVMAVEPATGAVTLAHDDIKGFTPAAETMYPVPAPDVSECLRPGDTVDFTIDAAKHMILGVNLLNYDQ